MKRLVTEFPFRELSGKLQSPRTLEYAEKDNPAFEAPTGRNYARNYKPCMVACKRASDGLQFFQIKSKTATTITDASKLRMALFGGAAALVAGIVGSSYKVTADSVFELAKQAGQTDKKTLREFLTEKIRIGLAAKEAIIQIQAAYDGTTRSLNVRNPWCIRTGVIGGVEINVGTATVVRFWDQLAYAPGRFNVMGMKGIWHLQFGSIPVEDFQDIIGSAHNVLGLTEAAVMEQSYKWVKFGNSYLVYDYEGVKYGVASSRSPIDADWHMDGNFYLSDTPGQYMS